MTYKHPCSMASFLIRKIVSSRKTCLGSKLHEKTRPNLLTNQFIKSQRMGSLNVLAIYNLLKIKDYIVESFKFIGFPDVFHSAWLSGSKTWLPLARLFQSFFRESFTSIQLIIYLNLSRRLTYINGCNVISRNSTYFLRNLFSNEETMMLSFFSWIW